MDVGQGGSVSDNGHKHPNEADADKYNDQRESSVTSENWHENGNEASKFDEREGSRVPLGNDGKVYNNEIPVDQRETQPNNGPIARAIRWLKEHNPINWWNYSFFGLSSSVCDNGHRHHSEADATRCNDRMKSSCTSEHWHKNGNEASRCDEGQGRRCVPLGNDGKVDYNEIAVGKSPMVRQALRNWGVSRALQSPH